MKFMFPRKFWREIGIGTETILLRIGSFAIAKYDVIDVWTIGFTKISKVKPLSFCDYPF